MIHYYICPVCSKEIRVSATTAKGSLVSVTTPEQCPECKSDINEQDVIDDIQGEINDKYPDA